MTHEARDFAGQASELDEVIAAYLQAVEAGESPSPQPWLDRYPQFAAELAEFFAADDRLNEWVNPPELAATELFVPATQEYRAIDARGESTDALTLRPGQATRETIGPGTLLANSYRVFDVKSGGMGRVYLADNLDVWQRGIGLKVAIKTVVDFDEWRKRRRRKGAPTDAAAYAYLLARFRQEALAWVRLGTHQNIIFAWQVFEVGNKPYLLMEYADSGSLADWIRQSRLTVPLALDFALQFCEGMKHAVRAAGMVHRDIKPANVLTKDHRIVKVSDFGLSKAFTSQVDQDDHDKSTVCEESLSLAGAGTPCYMAPEQWQSLARADTRSDIFSFGAMLYEMLTSHKPFATVYANDLAAVGVPLPAVHEIDARVPPELSAVVARCLMYDPADRYASFDAVAAELARIAASLGTRLPIPNDPDAIPEERLTPSLQVLRETFSLISLARYEDAIRCAQRGIDIDPENYEHWVNKGKALMEIGDFGAARECFARSTNLRPDVARAWSNLGWADLELGNPVVALSEATRAIDLDARFGEAWMCRGCCEHRLGRNEEAVTSLQRAAELEPHNWKVHYNLADCLAQTGRPSEAFAPLRRAMEIHPDYPPCWGRLAWLHGATGSWQEARAAIDKAIALAPENAGHWAIRAWIFSEGLADLPAARLSLSAAMQLNPDDPYARLVRDSMTQTTPTNR